MKTYTVQYQQSLLDIALQELGDVSGIVELALLNNIGITEDLEAGQILQIDETKVLKPAVVKYYKDQKITLATDVPRPNKSQTISFAKLPTNLEPGDTVFLNAVASSGLPVVYTSTNPSVATIVSNTLTVVGLGTTSIIASQPGDSIWFMASTSQNLVIENACDPYCGLPASLRSAVAFRFNVKDEQGFVLRNSGGVDYVVSYTDPISGITISQSVEAQQAVLDVTGCLFGGNESLFTENVFAVNQIKSAVAVANFLGGNTFVYYNCLVTLRKNIPYSLFLGGDNTGSTNIYDASPAQATNIRINNQNTSSFLPMSQIKSVYVEASASDVNVFIGRDGARGNSWIGNICDIILFNRFLTPAELAQMQTYLEGLHNFTT